MYSMICDITGCICYVSENFGLGSLHDDYTGLAGATPQVYSVAPYRFVYRFVNELSCKVKENKNNLLYIA